MNIEEYIQSHTPPQPSGEDFIPKLEQRLDAIEGIRSDIQCERKHFREAILLASLLCLLVGSFAMALFLLKPAPPVKIHWHLSGSVTLWFWSHKEAIILPLSVLVLAGGVLLVNRRRRIS